MSGKDPPACSACGGRLGLGAKHSRSIFTGDKWFCSESCEMAEGKRKQDSFLGWFTTWLIIGAFVVAFLLFFQKIGEADHLPMHRVLYVGKMTEAPVRILACMDVDAATSVVVEHEKNGQESAKARFHALILMGECFVVSGRILVEDVLWKKRLQFEDGKHDAAVVQFRMEGLDESLYAPLARVDVREHPDET